MSDMSEFCTELMHWLDGGRSPWHTVAMAEQALTAQGFTPLELGAPFAVKRGGRYFVSSGTFLAAVTVGARDVFRIAASHTDWPCMRIKPQPELVSGGCCRLSVEPYGGAILNTWLDRPLGLAGVALVRTDDPMRPARRLVAWHRMQIPFLMRKISVISGRVAWSHTAHGPPGWRVPPIGASSRTEQSFRSMTRRSRTADRRASWSFRSAHRS